MKNLFNFIEVNCSSHYDGLIHSEDFKRLYLTKSLDLLTNERHDGMAIMFDQFGRTFSNNFTNSQGIKTRKPAKTGELILSFLDFLAGMLAFNKEDFITNAELTAVYEILVDDADTPHLTRQQLYDSIRNSVENAHEDLGFIAEFN